MSAAGPFDGDDWRTPAAALPAVDFIVGDLKRTFLRVADNLRWYEQTWLGVPIWQLGDDLVALQRIVVDLKPAWIVETGTKFGGSAIFFASMLALLGRSPAAAGGVVTVDIEETPRARALFGAGGHPLCAHVKQRLIGDAASPEIVAAIRATLAAAPGGPLLVFLDDWHDGEHVFAELQAYSTLLSPGDMLIVGDTTFADLADTPVAAPSVKYPDARRSNPRVALHRFLAAHGAEFEVVTSYTSSGISNFPDSVLRRRGPPA